MARRRILIIHNPVAGNRAGDTLNRMIGHLSALGAVVTVRDTRGRGDAESMARSASPADFDVVVAAGGDGTINEVANGLADGDLPLAILPMGTANVLAAEIRWPTSSRAIARAIVEGEARSVHMGLANGRRFVMMAGIGFDAHVVAHINPWLKRAIGRFAYVIETLACLFRYPYRRYRVTVDGVRYDPASVVVANGHYYGGRFTCAPEARLDDDALHVCLFLGSGPVNVLRYALFLVLGRLHRLRDVIVVRATSIVVEGVSGEPVQCDGDVCGGLPLRIDARRARLRLVAAD